MQTLQACLRDHRPVPQSRALRRSDPLHLAFQYPERDIISLKFYSWFKFKVRLPFEIIKHSEGNAEDRSTLVGVGLAFIDRRQPTRLYELSRTGEMPAVDMELLRPRLDAVLDFSMVSRWIRHCEESHGSSKCRLPIDGSIAELFAGLGVLRFVDVLDGCIFETHDHVPQYVALSYVWGAVSNFRLTKSNNPNLLIPGAIHRVWAVIPATIKDAITLCQKLDMRYLWVDSLCLLQNDEGDVRRGVAVMDHIYERAWLTVIAACGHDANAGLPGVRAGTRAEQANAREVYPGLLIGAYTSPEHLVLSSVYNTRAWTYVLLHSQNPASLMYR